MKIYALLLIFASTIALATTDPSRFPFDRSQLSGLWSESYNTDLSCGPDSPKARMEISASGRRLNIRYDRRWDSALGDAEVVDATITPATLRTLVIRYDNENRMKPSGTPVEWELAIVAPGVYRWRETGWKPGQVNTVVGIRCSQ